MESLRQRLPSRDAASGYAAGHGLYVKSASQQAGWYMGESEIAGQGIFASRDYPPDAVIGVGLTDGGKDELGVQIWNLTELARYCNHQTRANAKLVRDGDLYHLVASRPITQDEEIVADYAQVSRAIGPYARMLWDGKPIPTKDLSEFTEREDS
jgi:hypothetical protein